MQALARVATHKPSWVVLLSEKLNRLSFPSLTQGADKLSEGKQYADVAAFCDFAAGGDENCLAVRRGNRVQIIASWREPDTMKAVGRFIQLFREQELRPEQISADEGGLGMVMCDRLAESGWAVNRVNNGSPADKPEAYANKGAEIWFEGRVKIERGEIILPNDPELFTYCL